MLASLVSKHKMCRCSVVVKLTLPVSVTKKDFIYFHMEYFDPVFHAPCLNSHFLPEHGAMLGVYLLYTGLEAVCILRPPS